MAKVFTVENVKSDLHELIDQFHGSSEEETAMVKEALNITFNLPLMEDSIVAIVMQVFEHPETANLNIVAFSANMAHTCPFPFMVDAMTSILIELISDFCGV